MGAPTGTVVRIDGGKIRGLREEKGLTQLYVATVVGVTTDTISRWENRHYNTVKHDNAVKLAEALELPLDEILLREPPPEPPSVSEPSSAGAVLSPPAATPPSPEERTEPESHPATTADEDRIPPPETLPSSEPEPQPASPAPGGRRPPWTWLLAALLALGALAPVFWRFSSPAPESPALQLLITRTLPAHAAAGQSFPVVISIDGLGEEDLPFILKEQLPAGFKPRTGAPPFTTANEKSGLIKWISKTSAATPTFSYMASLGQDLKEGKSQTFQGSITVKNGSSSTFPITGQDTLDVAPFHWADTNRDGRIDDDEILAVHDSFSMIVPTDLGLAEIEAIWSTGGYEWNPRKRHFTPRLQRD